MNKIYYFPTWEEQNSVLISLNDDYIMINNSGLSDFCNSIEYDIISKKKRFDKFFLETTNDPILAKLCEESGAKMYGDYVVMRDGSADVIDITEDKTYNAFEEYSKFLRNKENNWNKCKIILKPLDN
jgi:hypothetical protein